MKKLFTYMVSGCLVSLLGLNATAQNMSINESGGSPHPSAMLDVESSTKGVLLPRMTETERLGITSPSDGLIVFQTDGTKGLYIHDASISSWVVIADSLDLANINTSLTNDSTRLTDSDGNTLIQVEESSNENRIRFDIDGNEVYVMDGRRLSVSNTGGSVYIGDNAGSADLSGDKLNVAIGELAMENNGTGTSIVAIGRHAQRNGTGGFGNVSIGESALYSNLTGSGNTNIGLRAGILNTNSTANTLLGSDVDYFNTTGSNNTLIGFEAGRGTNTHTKSGNIFIGYQAGYNEVSSNKLYIENSNSASPLIYGEFNNDIAQINGTFRTSDGTDTLVYPSTDGALNEVLVTNGLGQLTFSDLSALPISIDEISVNPNNRATIQTGNLTVRLNGINSYIFREGILDFTQTGGNILIRTDHNGSWNTAFSSNSNVFNTLVFSGTHNFLFGRDALRDITTGSNNIAMGSAAMRENETGNNNTALQAGALINLTSGSNNIAIGPTSGSGLSSGTNNIFLNNSGEIGSYSNRIYIGTLLYGEGNTLEVNGMLRTTPSGNGLQFTNNQTAILGNVTNSGDIRFRTNNVDRMRIDMNGNLGIGTISPTARLDVVGNIEIPAANEYTYDGPKTNRISVSASAFTPLNELGFDGTSTGNARWISGGINGNSGILYAPVNLPNGASITGFEVFYNDQDLSLSVFAELEGLALTPNSIFNVATTPSSTAGLGSVSDNTISHTVDNGENVYFIKFHTFQSNMDLWIRGAVITYTVNNAD